MTETEPKAAAPLDDEAPHVLVVDDDQRIRTLLSRYLGEHGYRVTVAESGPDARRKLEGFAFDLLIVDVMMPGETGFSLTRAIRANSNVPILMLTARSETENRIEGLESGADDYLAKPFEPRELLLRIGAILRRHAAQPPKPRYASEVRFGPFVFEIDKQLLRRGDEPIRLTDRERQLMKMFAERPGDTIARHLIVGEDTSLGERTADVQINRLRRKIEADPANPLYLQTVRGIGYRLVAD
jgi:two-component system, OmpR family, phosphate regulon response regulator OmpR